MTRFSLSQRLLAWILPITLGAVLLTGTAAYRIASRQILRDAQKEAAALTQGAAEQIQAFLDQRNNDLKTIAQSPLFRDHYTNVEYGLAQEAGVYRREIERMLLEFSKRSKVYPELCYVDAGGRVAARILRSRVAPPGENLAGTDSFKALRVLRPGQRSTDYFRRMPGHGSPVILYGMPLLDEQAAFRGGLFFHYSLSQINGLLSRIRIGNSGRSVLTDRRGRALTRESRALDAGSLSFSATVPGTPWSVLSVVRSGELLDDLERINALIVLISLLCCAALSLIITGKVRNTMRPIQELAGAAGALADGKLDARASLQGPKEAASLANAFNVMAERLKRRTEDLQQRVRELTALQRMSDAVLHQLGRREIGRVLLESAITGLGFDRGTLYWVDEARGEIIGECVRGTESVGFTDEAMRLRRIPTDSGDILAHVVRERAAIHVADASADPRCDPRFLAETRTRAFCAAPIVGRERMLGVIGVDNHASERTITPQQIRSLSLFCGAAGLALENAELFGDLLRSEARYRTAIENSPDAVVSLDQNLRITLWNRRAESLFGYQPTEAAGRTLSFLFDRQAYEELRRKVETRGSVRREEAAGIARDGRRLELSVSWTGQPGERGAAREWFVLMQDVTDQKRLQNQLIQAEKMSVVGNLIAGVAHELNNPLAAVTGFSELLLDGPGTSEQKEDIAMLHYSALRCSDIVQGLLLFARPGPSILHRIALNQVVQSAVSLFEYRFVKLEGIRMEISLEPGIPDVAGNFQKLQQVFVNLINNARDALKDRAGPRVIRIRTSSSGRGARSEVEDTGPGIPLEMRRRVFDPFFTTKAPGKGTGLGLSISAQILSECGGALRCDAGTEGGARFVATFPECPRELAAPAEAAALLPPAAAGRRVLVVDDEPDLVRLIVRILSEDGVVAVGCACPLQAKERLARENFDLVITDVEMGKSGGVELMKAACELQAPPLFVFVTGDVLNPALTQELLRWKAPVLTKPFLRTDFLRVVRRALNKAAAKKL